MNNRHEQPHAYQKQSANHQSLVPAGEVYIVRTTVLKASAIITTSITTNSDETIDAPERGANPKWV